MLELIYLTLMVAAAISIAWSREMRRLAELDLERTLARLRQARLDAWIRARLAEQLQARLWSERDAAAAARWAAMTDDERWAENMRRIRYEAYVSMSILRPDSFVIVSNVL